jgi:hypothetical protein
VIPVVHTSGGAVITEADLRYESHLQLILITNDVANWNARRRLSLRFYQRYLGAIAAQLGICCDVTRRSRPQRSGERMVPGLDAASRLSVARFVRATCTTTGRRA